MAAAPAAQPNWSSVSKTAFETTVWTLCGLSAVFIASRLYVRMQRKGRLRRSDCFLMVALPCLFAGVALLHSCLDTIYMLESALVFDRATLARDTSTAARLTAAIELLWLSIYSVKASFLAHFRFHKPLFAYVSVHLTRLYWVVVALCCLGLLFTLAVPIALCPTYSRCRYLHPRDTIAWERALTVIDIILDISIVTISLSLIWLANLPPLYAGVNAAFKSISIIAVAFASARLATQSTSGSHVVDYITLLFWLVIEAAAAIILASVTVFRTVVLDSLANDRTHATHLADLARYEDRLVSGMPDSRNTTTTTLPRP